MAPARFDIRRHIGAAVSGCLIEAAAYAVVITSPKSGGAAVAGILLLPGTILSFFIGGGMSMVDGLTPDWKTDLAFALGILLNAALLYGFCLLLAKMAKIVSETLQTT